MGNHSVLGRQKYCTLYRYTWQAQGTNNLSTVEQFVHYNVHKVSL